MINFEKRNGILSIQHCFVVTYFSINDQFVAQAHRDSQRSLRQLETRAGINCTKYGQCS